MPDTNKNAEASPYDVLARMSFRLRAIDRIDPSLREWSLRTQFIESHLLLFVAGGQGWLTADGKFAELRSGSIYVGCPGQLIEAAVHSLDEQGLYWISFDVIEMNEGSVGDMQVVKHNSRFPAAGEIVPVSPVSVGVLCEATYRHWQSEAGLKRFGCQIRFQELLYTILENHSHIQVRDDDASLEYVKDYIESNYKQKITIGELAKAARMSPRHFMRLFKKKYGCSTIDYLAIHRIKQAQMLMRANRKHRLKDIARHVGYQDDIYFRRKFKQVSGIPPAAFIRNSRQKIATCDSLVIGTLLALQIIPCAAPESHPWTSYYRRKYETDNVLPLSLDAEDRLEQLRHAKPDYIIIADCFETAEEQARLHEIAPVCVIPWSDNDWRTHYRFVAKFLGRVEVAEAWLERYEQKAGFVREQIAATIKEDRLLVVEVHGQQLQVQGRHSIAAVFHEDLRIAMPQGLESARHGDAVSLERLSKMEVDRLLVIVKDDEQSQFGWQLIMRSEKWRSMPAVRNERVSLFPSSPLKDYTAFTHELILDEVLKLWRDRA